MLSRTAKIIVPPLLKIMSRGHVNQTRNTACQDASSWASPLKLTGVPNCYQVSETLFRSGQPSPAGFRNLEELGIRGCISLRVHHTDEKATSGTRIKCRHLPIFGVFISDEKIVQILSAIHHSLPKPVLIHCYQGADRTGFFCAAYRIIIEHWSKEEAIREMTLGGFGYHGIYPPLVKMLEQLDVDKLRSRIL